MVNQLLMKIQNDARNYQIEPFVLDFLEFWVYLHEEAKDQTIDTALEFCRKVWDSHTYPFYQKYKKKGFIEYYEAWEKDYASITWTWKKRGVHLIPLLLFLYELYCHEQGLLEDFLKKIYTKETDGTCDDLYEHLISKMINFVPRLDEADINFIKAYQILGRMKKHGSYAISHKDFSEQLKVTKKTIQRRKEKIEILQMINNIGFLDMTRLGYETLLVIHQEEIPWDYPYLLLSAEMSIARFSILQIPLKKQDVLKEIQDVKGVQVIRPASRRIISWNLSRLNSGKETWKGNLPFSNPQRRIIINEPDVEFSLNPSNVQFRKLSLADIKILDFISHSGYFKSLTEFSQAIKMSRNEVSKRLAEFSKEKLFQRIHYFHKLGLTSQLIFISDEEKENEWVKHLQLFPLAYLFSCEDELPYYYFGFIKIPSKWISPMSKRMDKIKQKTGMKYYMKPSSTVDVFKWGISLAATYLN